MATARVAWACCALTLVLAATAATLAFANGAAPLPVPRRYANLVLAQVAGCHDDARALIAALAVGLDSADRAESYRRIPWIWRVAIAAAKRNDSAELGRIVDVAVPADGQPLTDWRAVVLGGGVINGITLVGAWPGARIDEILRDDSARLARWRRSLDLASAMTDDPSVPNGTRYDALRMIGLEPWSRRGAQIVRYLAPGTNAELQQGAVCALGDLPAPEATRALVDSLAGLTPGNRKFAIEALARDDDRRETLLDALEAGRIKASELPEAVAQLLADPARNRSHARAKTLLAR